MAASSGSFPFFLDIPVGVPVESKAVSEQATERVGDFHASNMFDIVTHYALAEAILCFGLSPLREDVERDGSVNVRKAVETHKLQHRYTLGLMKFLVTQDLFKEGSGEVFIPTPKGRAALSPGAFGWLQMVVRGYGNLMTDSLRMLRGEVKYGKDLVRNPLHVSVGSSRVSSSIGDDVPYTIIEEQGATFVADLGCGGGAFLINLAKRDKKFRGIGIDIAPAAVEAATETARAAGVGDRVKFVIADSFDLTAVADACKDVDIFYSFGMEHEKLREGEEAVLGHIDRMGELFPGKTYLLGEPMLHMQQGDGVFYWLHILSDQGMPRNIPGWYQLLTRLQKCTLKHVYVPDHQKIGAFFSIALGK